MPDALSTLVLPRVALFLDDTRPSGTVVSALEIGEALHVRGVDVIVHAVDADGTGFFRPPRCPSVLISARPFQAGMRATARERVDAIVGHLDETDAIYDVYHAFDRISGAALALLAENGRIPGFVRNIRHVESADGDDEDMRDRSIRSAAQTFAVNRLVQQRVRKTFGVDPTLIPNGVDATRFKAVSKCERARLRTELGFGDGPLYLVIGGIEPRNNILSILEAFANVRETQPSAVLAIAASAARAEHGAYEAAVEERATNFDLRIGTNVRVFGTLSDASLVTLMQAANALVAPSLVEGFGLAVLEALACETPVIASRIAPFTEYLAHDEALLVDPNDPFEIAEAMLNALEPAVATVLATNARESTRARSWATCAEAYLRAYRSLRFEPAHTLGADLARR